MERQVDSASYYFQHPTFTQRKKYTYCWTRDGCVYDSFVCTAKSSAHKNYATFENRLGVSKGFCY